MIQNYNDFITHLLAAGFSMGGGSDDGIYAVVNHGWNEQVDSPVQWHTGDADTDPWEWRMRVLDERDDIAYGKIFFKKSGFVTREWAPYFLAARRGRSTFEQEYDAGRMNSYAKRIYTAVTEFGALPLEEIKREGNFYRD